MHQAAAWNQQGVLLKQQGNLAGATECYQTAIRLQPDYAEAHFNLGLLWRYLGRVDEAVRCLERTAALRPDVLAVQDELGQMYVQQQRWSDAERVFARLTRFSPGDCDLLFKLAVARQELGQHTAAAETYHQILALQPRHAAALTNLGTVLKNLGQFSAAVECYRAAVDANPLLVAAHANLGNLWLELGEPESALTEYQLAAALAPRDAVSQINLGNALRQLERIPEAFAAYRQAAEWDPYLADAWINCAHLLKELGDFDRVRDVSRELARRFPSDPAHVLRASAACPLVFQSRNEMRTYREQLAAVTQSLAGWDWALDFSRWTVFAPECPYNLQFLDGNLRPLKSAFARIYERFLSKRQPEMVRNTPHARPRIGFVVTARHETAFLKLLGGVVERLDGRRWELIVLCSQTGVRRVRDGLRRHDVTVIPFPERFDHVVATVRDAACDLLYYWEVGTDPTNYFLPFLRLAPVQVTSWGIQVTTGIPNIDAYLSSALVEAEDADGHYSERLVRASTLLTYQTPIELPARPHPREYFGEALAGSRHLYGCVQNLGKFHPDFDEILADILRRDPLGVIVAARDRNGFAADILQSRWRRELPDVADRMILTEPLAQAEYLSLLAVCDVLLDPLHFGGVTTTYDAMALHQPVVTLPSHYHRGRYTAGCLEKIGVTQTIARDRSDYARIAVELACDGERRQALREQIREASPELFWDQAAIEEHERILEELLAPGR